MKISFADSAEAEHVRGGDDPAVAVPGRAAEAAQPQQEVLRGEVIFNFIIKLLQLFHSLGAERVLLRQPDQPVPLGGGQGGTGQEERHHAQPGEEQIKFPSLR